MAGDTYSTVHVPDNAKTLLDAGRAMGAVIDTHGGWPTVVVPNGYKTEPLGLPPEKIARSVKFQDVESFALYVNKFKTAGAVMFATLTDEKCEIGAHLDYHDKPSLDGAVRARAWSSHTAQLVCVQTKEWQTWMEHNGSKDPFTQVEFAQFLEDNERLFRSPDAAGLLELITTLEGKSNVRFNSAIKLSNGKAKFDYEEDVQLHGGVNNGQIEIPTELTCAIIPFENGPEPYTVRSRLRYRLNGRQLVFWYETITPHLVLRDAAKKVFDTVREKVADAPLLIGG